MAVLLDRLSRRGTERIGQTPQPASPLPTISDTTSRPPARTLTTAPLSRRLSQIPQRGAIGSLPQNVGVQKRFVSDLPAKQQLEGIQQILSGQDTNSPIVNNFVKGMSAQGKSPEEIIAAFKTQQKASGNPLVLL